MYGSIIVAMYRILMLRNITCTTQGIVAKHKIII